MGSPGRRHRLVIPPVQAAFEALESRSLLASSISFEVPGPNLAFDAPATVDFMVSMRGVRKGGVVEVFGRSTTIYGDLLEEQLVGAFVNRSGKSTFEFKGELPGAGQWMKTFRLVSLDDMAGVNLTTFFSSDAQASAARKSALTPTKPVNALREQSARSSASSGGTRSLDAMKLYQWSGVAGGFVRVSLVETDVKAWLKPMVQGAKNVFLTHGWNDGLERGAGGGINSDEYMEVLADNISMPAVNVFAVDWQDFDLRVPEPGAQYGRGPMFSSVGSNPNPEGLFGDLRDAPFDNPLADAHSSANNGWRLGRLLGTALKDKAKLSASNTLLVGHSNGGAFMSGVASTLGTTRSRVAELVALDTSNIPEAHARLGDAATRVASLLNVYAPPTFANSAQPAANPLMDNVHSARNGLLLALSESLFGIIPSAITADSAVRPVIVHGYGSPLLGHSNVINVEIDGEELFARDGSLLWQRVTHTLVPLEIARVSGPGVLDWVMGAQASVAASFGLEGGEVYRQVYAGAGWHLERVGAPVPPPLTGTLWTWATDGTSGHIVGTDTAAVPARLVTTTITPTTMYSNVEINVRVNVKDASWSNPGNPIVGESIVSVGVSGTTQSYLDLWAQHEAGGFRIVVSGSGGLGSSVSSTILTYGQERDLKLRIEGGLIRVWSGSTLLMERIYTPSGPVLAAQALKVTLGGHSWHGGARYAMTADFKSASIVVW